MYAFHHASLCVLDVVVAVKVHRSGVNENDNSLFALAFGGAQAVHLYFLLVGEYIHHHNKWTSIIACSLEGGNEE